MHKIFEAVMLHFWLPSVHHVSYLNNCPSYLPSQGLFVASFTLVLPFFPTGSFAHGRGRDVATAFTMARILSNIPISRGGPTSLVIYDIHALRVGFTCHDLWYIFEWKDLFRGSCATMFRDRIPLLKQRLHQASPILTIRYCMKVREGDKRFVKPQRGESSLDSDVVIVDDLVRSGGTLIECRYGLSTMESTVHGLEA
ncbi:hypothetical protein IFM89_032150 [Coptis chinensis]|uniref:Phosphoribosyltransferase domain-containing protein n=1 Tax=Coptis chinensis TaxID=261450 RepID=A0A835IZL2_9MAGN|nr:hypothetical protein IFM89_032150 [Coptis chinensis]